MRTTIAYNSAYKFDVSSETLILKKWLRTGIEPNHIICVQTILAKMFLRGLVELSYFLWLLEFSVSLSVASQGPCLCLQVFKCLRGQAYALGKGQGY